MYLYTADLVSDVTTVVIPVSGPYLLYLGCDVANMSGAVYLKLNKREQLMVPGRCDIVEMDEDDVLQVRQKIFDRIVKYLCRCTEPGAPSSAMPTLWAVC